MYKCVVVVVKLVDSVYKTTTTTHDFMQSAQSITDHNTMKHDEMLTHHYEPVACDG